ncbi:hypothetical protein J5N97_000063 [Dioscorea zingiberensis]|uniref:AN1-type domain-containing protein n=1 Tax=Dioscorea zingiberensis TaxID=325984 RepID=A0A9D5H3C6_9LILI|nr:hypothetical protein J5N97_000063 [Dioscorea zingiberensis]
MRRNCKLSSCPRPLSPSSLSLSIAIAGAEAAIRRRSWCVRGLGEGERIIRGFDSEKASGELTTWSIRRLVARLQRAQSTEQVKLASASIDSIVNDGGSSSATEPVAADVVDAAASLVESKAVLAQPSDVPAANKDVEVKAKEGPTRCNACKKRVGLTGFNCRCGNIFCAVHRYSDKHSCPLITEWQPEMP